MNLELAIQQLFIKNGWKLSVAESCTGGALSAALTQVPGTSEYFLGGIVAYSNLLKQKYLHVFESILLASGAVSKETVQAMVQGLISTSSADFGIAISGIAGPSGGTPENPVGTVWISVMHKGSSPQSQCFQLKGSRKEIIEDSVKSALEFLYSYAKDHDTYLQDKKEN